MMPRASYPAQNNHSPSFAGVMVIASVRECTEAII